MGEKAICLIVLIVAMMVIVDSVKMIFGEDEEPRERKKPFELIVDDRLVSDVVSARTLRRYRRNSRNGLPRIRSPTLGVLVLTDWHW